MHHVGQYCHSQQYSSRIDQGRNCPLCNIAHVLVIYLCRAATMSVAATKRWIAKEINSAGLAGCVDLSAIGAIMEHIEKEGSQEVLHDILRVCQAGK